MTVSAPPEPILPPPRRPWGVLVLVAVVLVGTGVAALAGFAAVAEGGAMVRHGELIPQLALGLCAECDGARGHARRLELPPQGREGDAQVVGRAANACTATDGDGAMEVVVPYQA